MLPLENEANLFNAYYEPPEMLRLADAEFDDEVASLVLHQLEDWSGPLAELRRVLKPARTIVEDSALMGRGRSRERCRITCRHEPTSFRTRTRAPLVSRPSGGSDDVAAPKGARGEPELEETYERLVAEGHERLDRPLLPLLATGLLGGVDVGVGVLIYLLVEAETGSRLLASMAFTIGFVALLLANSELFTENFLVPVISVVAKVGTLAQLIRLWVVTLAANLVAGFAMAGMIVVALPDVHEVAVKAGSHYAHLGVSWRSFFLAVLAGAVITLMTRMQHATENLGVRLVAAVLMSFVLVGAQLFHSILDSILMFAGLLTGEADYGYLDWLGALGWSAFGNLVGGLVLVTGIRLLQIPHRVAESREQGQTG